MKKYYLTFLGIILYNFVLGQHYQYFQLTPDGFKTAENTNYLVIEMDGSASELYNNVLLSIGRRFNSPKDVISSVQNKQISINAIYPNIVKVKGGLGMANAYFGLVIEFKDNKIRIFSPEIKYLKNDYGAEILYICKKTSALTQSKDQSIFDYKTFKIRSIEYKEAIETAFDLLIQDIIYSQNNTNNEDW